MIRPDMAKWGQTLSDLRQMSVTATHPRTRERFLALYMIGSGQSNATRWATEIGRSDNTVMAWVHLYNTGGPEALSYRRTGGRTPFLAKTRSTSSLRP
jgi:transposase